MSVATAIVLGGGWFWLSSGEKEGGTYRFAKIDRGDVAVVISATGTLNAVTTVQVGSQVSGTIAKLYADFNTQVKEGQLLAQLDPTFLQASVNEQKANVDRAMAQVHEADRNFSRTSDLFAKSLVSQADLDASTTALEAAKAGLAQARAALERSSVNLRYATIKAPISGVVISRNVDVGQTVAASLQAPTLFTIAQDLRKMKVEASVDEADIGNVKTGQIVTFRVDAFPEEVFNGIVSQIRLAPVITQNVVTYTVIIDVENRNLKLMPGMTATVSIEVAQKENVLRVPVQATRFTPPTDGESAARPGPQGGAAGQAGGSRRKPAENEARIWVMLDGKPAATLIKRGLANTRFVEVVESELKEGDEVIVGIVGAQQSAAQGTTNPFGPQRMGGPGGGRRGGI